MGRIILSSYTNEFFSFIHFESLENIYRLWSYPSLLEGLCFSTLYKIMLACWVFHIVLFSCLYVICKRSSGSARLIKLMRLFFPYFRKCIYCPLVKIYKQINNNALYLNVDFCNLKRRHMTEFKMGEGWYNSSEVMCQWCEILNNNNLFIFRKSQRGNEKPCTIITWPPLWEKTNNPTRVKKKQRITILISLSYNQDLT